MKISGKIAKTDATKKLVFGWASVAKDATGREIIDAEGDVVSIEELERAAYEYVSDVRKVGEMHETLGVGELVESMMFTPEKLELLGLDEQFTQGWWVGIRVTDDKVWDKLKRGEYKMFSIGGRASREEISDD